MTFPNSLWTFRKSQIFFLVFHSVLRLSRRCGLIQPPPRSQATSRRPVLLGLINSIYFEWFSWLGLDWPFENLPIRVELRQITSMFIFVSKWEVKCQSECLPMFWVCPHCHLAILPDASVMSAQSTMTHHRKHPNQTSSQENFDLLGKSFKKSLLWNFSLHFFLLAVKLRILLEFNMFLELLIY